MWPVLYDGCGQELSRTAYSWGFHDGDGNQMYMAGGAAWPSLPQISRATEQLQLALLMCLCRASPSS
eukprot:7083125-Pyramimonas_sp.AAC.1